MIFFFAECVILAGLGLFKAFDVLQIVCGGYFVGAKEIRKKKLQFIVFLPFIRPFFF